MKKTALILGASSDIGKEIAKKLSKDGFSLALSYNTNKIEESEFSGSKTYKLDVLKDDLSKFFDKVEKENQYVDTFVYCCGVAQKRALLFDVPDEEIDKLIQTNLTGAIKCVKYFTKNTLNKRPANIVLVGSFVEKNGCSCESVYTATKSGLSGLCRSLATELGNLDMRINVVAPGFIDTKMNNNLTAEEKEEIANMTPLSRLGTAQDVANAVSFLVSDKASYITGQTLFVDGGLILE